ncbi:carbamoyl-phosphate synthase large chain, c-terminal section [Plakobranchus ocellatus]|uniref:Carbamoyl-phosphate synthase large chain, c-terminal section n=1 Tax=Plakobranchus ocellatus TaxID=259542 RepID=A0AAV4DUF4_9GAST|nr:carbamoyl-phosphate synthase large chain, c-terminal section [Plakobranchus ocellatus]
MLKNLRRLLIGYGKRVVRLPNTSRRLLVILLLPRLKLSQNLRYRPNVARNQEHSQQYVFTTKNSAPMHALLSTWVQIFHPIVQVFEKRQCQPLGVAAAGIPHQPNTLSVVDRTCGLSYLVDTGAEVSVYPASVQDRRAQQPITTLTGANGTSIHT